MTNQFIILNKPFKYTFIDDGVLNNFKITYLLIDYVINLFKSTLQNKKNEIMNKSAIKKLNNNFIPI